MENKHINILAIDDNADNLISIKALLSDAFPEATVFLANSGQKGLDEALKVIPDVILLDIVMPLMDGFDVCRKLKADANLKEIPVVFLTAIKGDKESRITALECGAEAFLAKPIDVSELTAQIRAMVKISDANILKRDEKLRLAQLVEAKTSELTIGLRLTTHLVEELRLEIEARRISEEGLSASEEKYRRIAENISDVVWILDMDLNAVYISPSIEKLYGESLESFLKRPVEEKFPQRSLDIIKAMFAEEIEIEKDPSSEKIRSRVIEIEHYRADKSKIWVAIHGTFTRDNNGNIDSLHGVMRDITDRKLAEIELTETKDYLEKLFHSSNAPALVWNHNFKITKLNGSFEKLTGKTTNEILGTSMLQFFPLQKLKIMTTMFEESQVKKTVDAMEVDITHVDGTVRTILWSTATIFELEDPRKFSVIAQGQDITQRLEAEKNLIHLSFHDHLTGLYNRRYFEEELSRLDTERNLPISIIMGDINGLKLINDSFGHSVGDELLKKTAESMKRFFRDDDIVARLGGDEFAIILPKTDTMETENIIRRISDYSSKEKVMNIDLSISFGSDTKKVKSDDLLATLKNAEDSMYRLKLYENKSMRSKTIDVIMNALVEKSQRELTHSKRVSSICEKIAMELHLKSEFVSQIRMAGLVHDIGKIGIDEKILNKPASLNKDEWAAIKKHPEAGWRILNSANEFSELSEFVLCHHERWDGSGYPRGLKGEQIPIEARIIMIADSYDAMTSMRSYRGALSEEDAANELRRYAGIQFDPDIVKLFVEKVLNREWI